MASNALPTATDAVEARDESELANFGFKQELRRDWSLLHNFGVSFSIIVSSARSPWDGKLGRTDCVHRPSSVALLHYSPMA